MKHQVAKPCMSLLTILALFASSPGATAGDIRTERVQFASGHSHKTINGHIEGYESVSYLIGAQAGQTMTVTLDPSNAATYFNVYAPGKGPGDEAIANSEMTPQINHFKGELPASGDYTLSVYMVRAAARRDERSQYRLDIAIFGDAQAAPSTHRGAAHPSFDCAKASHEVEKLICKDAELAQLDRSLAELYAAVLRSSAQGEQKSLKTEQRGWVKGRDDCWKSDDMRRCVADEYRDRIDALKDR